jgi:predicted RNA-binding protein YlxR (DUF448 family)
LKQKKRPVRMCVACRQGRDKAELIRVVGKGGFAVIDPTGKMDGRGAYVCPTSGCIEKAYQKKILAHALGVVVSEEFYRKMLEEVSTDGTK